MSTICHASIDENKNIKGGLAGDQTGKEVCTRNWYLKNWQYVIRPRSEKIAQRAVKIALDIANNPNVGYNQARRNTLYTELKEHGYNSLAIGKCDTDCSAFMTVCYIAAGIKSLEYVDNAPTTSTMVRAFRNTGQFDVLNTPEYLRIDAKLKPGDILVQPGHHTAMITSVTNPYKEPVALLNKGVKGNIVKWLQWHLVRQGYLEWNEVDGEFGKRTHRAVCSFQAAKALDIDGVVGSKTVTELKK